MLRKILTASVVCAALATPAAAQDTRLRIVLEPWYKFGHTQAQIVHVPPPTSDYERAQQAIRIEVWEKACKPVGRVDDLGVTRLSYAMKGCEFGRTE